MSLVPVILCGGAGSRLWPVSREAHPKPFIRLADGQSLLQKAFLRGANLDSVTEVLTVTNREFFFQTKDEFGEVNTRALNTNYLLEPFGKNTAAAVAAAAIFLMERDPHSIMLVLPADHLVANQAAFAEAVSQAVLLAQQDKLVTFGIKPDAPETGYGYIEAQGNNVLRFVEKPDAQTALNYVESGNYLWNSGMFCFKAEAVLREMGKHCPNIVAAVKACLNVSKIATAEGYKQCELDADLFSAVPEDSIDYAIMEKSDSVAVVPCNIGWSDIGSWNALGDLSVADSAGNRIEGEALTYNATNCTIRSDGRMIGVVGVQDLIIVDTPDALLVAHKKSAQDVKQIYAQLKASGHDAYRLHRTVHRPWGTYTVLEEGDRYKIKRIEVSPGARLSLQMHHHRSEHWIVVSGMAKVVNGDEQFFVSANQSTYIPAGHKHRLENPGVVNLVMIEVQSGEYLGEDDIVRFDDNYGRA